MKFKECLSFDDVTLEPRFSSVMHRKDVDLSMPLDDVEGGFKLRTPIVSAPMNTVTEENMLAEMSKLGGLGILHRYCSIERQVEMLKAARHADPDGLFGAAIGATGDFLERAEELIINGCYVICIDVAHGHHVLSKSALQTLRKKLGYDVHLMAGNVATAQGYLDLAHWGASSVRCGIGSGAACATRVNTAHGMPTFQTILECSEVRQDGCIIIADGGIKNSGDMVKSFAAGADLVMVGSLLAGTAESPGEPVAEGTKLYKKYTGMASREAQTEWRGKSSAPEGVSHKVPYTGPLKHVIEDLRGGIASGCSYSGVDKLKELASYAKFRRQTHSSFIEGTPHILNQK